MALELVRKRGGELGLLPDTQAIKHSMAVATTPEAAIYLRDQLENILTQAKMLANTAIMKVMEAVRAYADYVTQARSGSDGPWSGRQPSEPSTEFQMYHQGLASSAAKTLGEKQVILNVAVSDNLPILRGYSEDGVDLDDSSVAEMDTLFNAWLASNQMISKGGNIYEATEDGQIKLDQSGKPVMVEAKTLKAQIGDQTSGFEQFVHKNNDSLQITIQHQPYPEQPVAREEAGPSTG